jgi:hypothetical protein
MSEEASLQFEKISLFTRDDPYSALEELWKDNRQQGRSEKSRNEPVGHIAFPNKATAACESGWEYEDTGRMVHVNTHLVPSGKRFHHYNSFRKSLPSHSRNHKGLDRIMEYSDTFMHLNPHAKVNACAGIQCRDLLSH